MPLADLTPELVLLVAAVGLLLLPLWLGVPRQGLCAPLALVALVLGAALCGRQLLQPAHASFGDSWIIDSSSIVARLIILATAACCILMAPDWLRSDRRHGEFYAVLLLGALGAMLMTAAADLLLLVVAVLLSSVTGYVLAGWHRAWGPSVEAGMKYFLVGAFANAWLLLGATWLFGLAGGTRFAALTAVPPMPLLWAGLGLAIVGVVFKLGAVPVHPWVADVAQGAPAPSAAFLTVVPKVGAAIALVRLLQAMPLEASGWRAGIGVLAVATMSLGNLMALWQEDLRRLLGWSSVSQAGYALMAPAVLGLTPRANDALLYFLAAYAAGTTCAFAVVTHLRGRTALADLRGLAAARPWVAVALTISLLSLVGIPPLGGFVGKLGLFTMTLDAGQNWLAFAALGNTVLSLFYCLRVVARVAFDAPSSFVFDLGIWSRFAVAVTTLAVLALGVGVPAAGWAPH